MQNFLNAGDAADQKRGRKERQTEDCPPRSGYLWESRARAASERVCDAAVESMGKRYGPEEGVK